MSYQLFKKTCLRAHKAKRPMLKVYLIDLSEDGRPWFELLLMIFNPSLLQRTVFKQSIKTHLFNLEILLIRK